MRLLRISVFGKTRALEAHMDQYLDLVSQAGMMFEDGLSAYLASGADEQLREKAEQISELKSKAGDLRRDAEQSLYSEMLLPDSRGDVLSLLDELGTLLDIMKRQLVDTTIEQPAVPEAVREDFQRLVAAVAKSVEFTAQASRAFFRNFLAVRDHIHKIGYYESEADGVALRLKRAVFASDLPLAQKAHVVAMVKAVDQLADEAKDVGERLSIYAIKRTL
ncbi:MAG TPA: DUF47 family protein [Planctomycetota bacterium]|nr:DUF47 family protein [Planctomycetota bacterium]